MTLLAKDHFPLPLFKLSFLVFGEWYGGGGVQPEENPVWRVG